MSTVSLIATVRDEPIERIARLVDSVRAQGIEELELLIAAPPTDRDQYVAARSVDWPAWLRFVDNPTGRRSDGLNAAIAMASGRLVCRVDARSMLPADYVQRCSRRLDDDPGIGVVGGHQIPMPVEPTATAAGIARGLANRFALGGSGYRNPAVSGVVETVYLGAWRRSELLDIGGFDSALDANEDFELCQRYRDRGFTVWLEPETDVAYEPRTDLVAVWRQYRAFGASKVRFWRNTGRRPNGRQTAALLAAVGAGIVSAASMRTAPVSSTIVALTLLLVALGAVDEAGSSTPASPGVRVMAGAAILTAWTGWLIGITSESLKGVVRR